MPTTEFNWKTSDGLNIYAKEWSINNPNAVLCIVHGLGEHCNRYNHLAAYFNDKGMACLAYDRRGHGQSEGARGRTPSYEAYLDEVADLINSAVERYPDLPIFLYGHSMGGNIVLNYALKRHPKIAGVVATGSWIQIKNAPSGALKFIGGIVNKLGGFVQSNGLQPSDVAKNPQVAIDYENDPLVHDKIGSIAGLQTQAAADYLYNFKGNAHIPMLVMHATEDRMTMVEGSRTFAAQAQGDVTLKEWPDVYHEIHNELNQNEVFDYTYSWMQSKL